MGDLHIATENEIKRGGTTDIYFTRTKEILAKEGKLDEHVVAEFTASSLQNWEWSVFCGLEEALKLMESKLVDIYALPEGTIFHPKSYRGIRVPVMVVEGPYGEFCVFETPLLGVICQATAIATKASRIKKAAASKTVISFGTRRMHPAISPMIERAAYIGGCDGFSNVSGAKLIGKEPHGTMPHALTIVMGGPERAFTAYDKHLPKNVPRIALVDTYLDEVAESLMACESIKNLYGVRLDTPSSRRGDFAEIVRQVRWELDVRGYQDVKIFVSGGLDENSVAALSVAGADGFGVGTSISNAPTMDFAMDIVEMNGRPVAKRGKYSGRKEVFRCPEDLTYDVGRKQGKCPVCGTNMDLVLRKFMEKGRLVEELPKPDDIRAYVLEQLEKVDFRS